MPASASCSTTWATTATLRSSRLGAVGTSTCPRYDCQPFLFHSQDYFEQVFIALFSVMSILCLLELSVDFRRGWRHLKRPAVLSKFFFILWCALRLADLGVWLHRDIHVRSSPILSSPIHNHHRVRTPSRQLPSTLSSHCRLGPPCSGLRSSASPGPPTASQAS